MSDIYEFTLFFHHETELAILVSENGIKEDAVWISKSQCEDIDGPFLSGEMPEIKFSIPEWLAIDKGLL